MKITTKQKELKYIILNGIYYKTNNIRNLEIDGIDVFITFQKHTSDKVEVIKGTVYNLQYVFEK